MTISWPLAFSTILVIALVYFSIWCFVLRFKGGWVCTTKDLLAAFISGGALGVIVMVSGVTDDIKQDTIAIDAATKTIATTTGEIKDTTGKIYSAVTGTATAAPTNGARRQDSEAAGNDQALRRLEEVAARLERIANQKPGPGLDPDLAQRMNAVVGELEKIAGGVQFSTQGLGDNGLINGTLSVQFVCGFDNEIKQLVCRPSAR